MYEYQYTVLALYSEDIRITHLVKLPLEYLCLMWLGR